MAINGNACEGIVISAQAEYGNDPVPLFEAGKGKISCVLELEAMATIQLSKATFESRLPEETGCFSYFGLTLKNCAIKHSISAQSGDAYYVSTLVATGQKG
jgi:hypothetical protein